LMAEATVFEDEEIQLPHPDILETTDEISQQTLN